jgi:glycosyltransferase involved in cell wall biosynthesis
MKILWVVNSYCGALSEKYGLKLTSGQWLNAEIEKEKKLNKNEIIVCTSGKEKQELIDQNIKYVVLPHGSVSYYADTNSNLLDWQELLNKEKPSLILVWGTEYAIGKCALRANAKKIPSLIYVQGVMSSIREHYRGGLTDKEIKSFTTVVEKIRKTDVFSIEKKKDQAVNDERVAITFADGIVVETDWAKEQYLKIKPDLKIYKSRLPLNKVFFEYDWNKVGFSSREIITTASAYALKGLHNTLKSLVLVKEKYPNVKLIVPGPNSFFVNGVKNKILQSGYAKSIKKFIKKNGLISNVIFVGALTAKEYAYRMQNAEIFLSNSAIENHGSAIREAMALGVPCVVSSVGGVPEIAINGENCETFNYGNVEETAEKIIKLFSDNELKEKYSQNAKQFIKDLYGINDYPSLNEIYTTFVKR